MDSLWDPTFLMNMFQYILEEKWYTNFSLVTAYLMLFQISTPCKFFSTGFTFEVLNSKVDYSNMGLEIVSPSKHTRAFITLELLIAIMNVRNMFF